jgi:hypothetical protein
MHRSAPDTWNERVVRWSPTVSRAVAYGAAVAVVGPLLYHLARGSLAYLGLFEDDFFYYAIIADNFATDGKLTYDGITITNGFHPLWFAVMLAIRVFTGGLGTAFYVVLALTFLASAIATYELSRSLARALGARPDLAAAIAALPSAANALLVSSGMETALGVPLLLWLFRECARSEPATTRRAAKLGLIASLTVLARLDTALAVAMLLVAWSILARPGLSVAVKRLAAFSAAGIALPLYAAWNLVQFGSVMPVSGLAKQLVERYAVSIGYLYNIAFTTPFGPLAGVALVLGVLAAFVLWRRGAPARPEAFVVGVITLSFAVLFWAVNSLSGWIQFGWYAFPMAPALVAALTFVGLALAPYLRSERLCAGAAGAAVAVSALVATAQGLRYGVTHGPLYSERDNGLLGMSIELAEHMRDRPGMLGMGAIGGFVAYVLDRPMVQLEGLVGDSEMVEHIDRSDNLGEVMDAYGVDYLVVSLHRIKLEVHDGCYVVTQPFVEWAGDRTKKMRAKICTPPVVRFVSRTPGNPWSIFDPLETMVFDVRDGRSRGPRADGVGGAGAPVGPGSPEPSSVDSP